MIGAKKYAKALIEAVGADNLESIIERLSPLVEQFKNDSFKQALQNVFVPKDKKANMLSGIYTKKDEMDSKIDNFLRLLGENGRIEFLPSILKELENALAMRKKQYVAILRSKDEIAPKTLEEIKNALSKKINMELSIKQELSDIDGIILSVDELGLEISFSKTRFIDGLKEHILKAI